MVCPAITGAMSATTKSRNTPIRVKSLPASSAGSSFVWGGVNAVMLRERRDRKGHAARDGSARGGGVEPLIIRGGGDFETRRNGRFQ
jgi:hypothetical protein